MSFSNLIYWVNLCFLHWLQLPHLLPNYVQCINIILHKRCPCPFFLFLHFFLRWLFVYMQTVNFCILIVPHFFIGNASSMSSIRLMLKKDIFYILDSLWLLIILSLRLRGFLFCFVFLVVVFDYAAWLVGS